MRNVRVLYVDVNNRRTNLGATSAIARLAYIVHPDGTHQTDVDRSPLKTTGQPGYTHVIWPNSHAAWDVLAVDMDRPSEVFLHSALDAVPRQPVISQPGMYQLGYEVFP